MCTFAMIIMLRNLLHTLFKYGIVKTSDQNEFFLEDLQDTVYIKLALGWQNYSIF